MILIVFVAYILQAQAVTIPIVDDDVIKPLPGQICGFGDMNKDRYTDLIVQHSSVNLFNIMLQAENGKFRPSTMSTINLTDPGQAVCAVADFNGDALPDILITSQTSSSEHLKSEIFLNQGTFFHQVSLQVEFKQPPMVAEVNGDGFADIVGFLENGEIYCYRGNADLGNEESPFVNDSKCVDEIFPNHTTLRNPFKNFPHIFADFTGDLSSEFVFALETEDNPKVLRFEVWQLHDMANDKASWRKVDIIPPIPQDTLKPEYFGNGVVGDFDGDGMMDLLVPLCLSPRCEVVEYILMYSKPSGWVSFQLDLKECKLIGENDAGTIFRVGDFTLDGYPDLIASVTKGNQRLPVVFENVEYIGNQNFSRKFEMINGNKFPANIIPPEIMDSWIRMSTFFDLKEDGNLDVLVEYNLNGVPQYSFIRCDEKGDTTFLKAQIFTNVCTRDCQNPNPNEIGSGISWNGACASFSMADSYGNTRKSVQCQLPQTSHRALYSPSILFGLGRSPNFVDEVFFGSPRLSTSIGNQNTSLKQIVPNSRLVIVPPEGNAVQWLSRLYLTPSRLIIQSIIVLLSVCLLLIILIIILHYRERHQDRKERQAQLNRFHFDAM